MMLVNLLTAAGLLAGHPTEPRLEDLEAGEVAGDVCSADRAWCAAMKHTEGQTPEQRLVVSSGGTLQEIALPPLPRNLGFDDSSYRPWQSRVVFGPGGQLLIGVIRMDSTMYSGGGGYASRLLLYHLGPGAAPRLVADLDWQAGELIRACFSEEDVAARAGACHDEYATKVTLEPAGIDPAGMPMLRYAAVSTSFPGPVSRDRDSLDRPPLKEEDLVTVEDPECSFTRVLAFDPASGTYRPDQPLPPCGENAAAVPDRPPAVGPGAPDPELAGHYYLSGVMETGSELLLRPEGRYQWYISYGAVDQVSEGTWGRSGPVVTLVADRPAPDAPLFSADERSGWTALAERRLRDAERDRQAEAVAARCPWTGWVTTAPPAYAVDLPGTARPQVNAALRAAAEQALAAAQHARSNAEAAMLRAVADGAGPQDTEAAEQAMQQWFATRDAADRVHREAGLPLPDLPYPAQPALCQAGHGEAEDVTEADWRRGIAVVVGDPAREMRLSDVAVTFVFDDGFETTATSGPGGWAVTERRQGRAVVGLRLAAPWADTAEATLPIDPLAEGIQTVRAEIDRLVAPAFDVLELDVVGRGLAPRGIGGLYARP